MMSITQQQLHQQPDIGDINHGIRSMNTSSASSLDGNPMEESSSALPIHSQASSFPLHEVSTSSSSSSSDNMMGGLFSQAYMKMEKPSIVLKPFQFSSMMDHGDNPDAPAGARSPPSSSAATAFKPLLLNTTVSYCNLFESYAVEPLPSQQPMMACISEGEDDTHSQGNKSQTTNGSVVGTHANNARTTSEESMLMNSQSSFVASSSSSPSNPSLFIASAPSFVASAHDPWATLSDHSSIITAAATASSTNRTRRSKSKNNLTNSVSTNTLYTNESSSPPQQKRSRHYLCNTSSRTTRSTTAPDEVEEPSLQSLSSSSSSSSQGNGGQRHPSQRTINKQRHAEKGAFTFSENGEYELMMHVQRGLPPNFNRLSALDSSNLILSTVDVYCHEEQWMFHIGQDKGIILKKFLQECIQQKKEQHLQQLKNSMEEEEESAHYNNLEMPPLLLVEVGTYCGYSAILLAKSLHELDPNLKFHVYTVETSSQNIMVASSMILMSKFHEHITILHHQPANESLTSLLQRKLKNPPARTSSISSSSGNISDGSVSTGGSSKGEAPPADFVFFDHDKEQYLHHLIQFEVNGIIQKGTHVAADNVLFHRLDGYRNHMTKLQRRGVTQTKMVQVSLEYCDEEDDVRDGMELTSYLKDPIRRRP